MWETLAIMALAGLAGQLLGPKPPKPKPAAFEDFEVPTAEEGRPLPVVYGTVRMTGPNCLWYGDLKVKEITQSDPTGLNEVVVGYKYYLGMHFGLAHPVDELRHIIIGGKGAWQGVKKRSGGNTSLNIDKPDLFGGETQEGGVDGKVQILWGGDDQLPDPYLESQLGQGEVPAYRKMTSLVFEQGYIGNSPYIKPWEFTLYRDSFDFTFYGFEGRHSPEVYTNFVGVNPAYIIYDVKTHKLYGEGLDPSDIDEESFTKVAETLSEEGFFLSILWTQEQSIDDFVKEICRYIDGIVYPDPITGKLTITLLREPSAFTGEVLDESNVKEIMNFSRPSWGETVNQIQGSYTLPGTPNTVSGVVSNMANIDIQGGAIINQTIDYTAINDQDLGLRVISRDLRSLSTPLARATLSLVPQPLPKYFPGDQVALSWGQFGLDSLKMRVIRATYGGVSKDEVVLDLIEDVFGLPENSYVEPTDVEWEYPVSAPTAATYVRVQEAGYFFVFHEIFSGREVFFSSFEEEDLWYAQILASASPDTIDYGVYEGSQEVYKGRGSLVDRSELTEEVGKAEVSWLYLDSLGFINDAEVGDFLQIGDKELCTVESKDLSNSRLQVNRGVLDTTPQVHSSGTSVRLSNRMLGTILRKEYLRSSTARVKLTPKTLQGELEVSDSPQYTSVHYSRSYRPYAPGKFRINGQTYPETGFTSDIVVSWQHRDRTQQKDKENILTQEANSVGPETGTTYTLRFSCEGDLLREVAGITGTSYTYLRTDENQDKIDEGKLEQSPVLVELYSVRDGVESFDRHSWTVLRESGFGEAFGQYFGGPGQGEPDPGENFGNDFSSGFGA